MLASDAVLEPGFSTNMTERLLYATYDVSHILLAAAADGGTVPPITLAAKVGAGKHSIGTDPAEFGLTLELEMRNDLDDAVFAVTDETWRMKPGPIVYENLYQGVFDAGLILTIISHRLLSFHAAPTHDVCRARLRIHVGRMLISACNPTA